MTEFFRGLLLRLRGRLSTYDGFRFAYILVALFCGLLLRAVAQYHAGLTWAGTTSANFVTFCILYWAKRIPLLVILTLCWLFFCWCRPLKRIFQANNRHLPSSRWSRKTNSRYRRLANVCSFCMGFNGVLLLPVCFLVSPTVNSLLFSLALAVISITSTWFTAFPSSMPRTNGSLARHAFETPLSFASASLGAPSIEATDELRHYHRLRRTSPSARPVQEYIVGGGDREWKGVESLVGDLATLAGSSPSEIRFHENTTSALKHVFDHLVLVGGQDACVIWQWEYDSIYDLVTQECKRKGVAVRPALAEVRAPASASIHDALVAECRTLAGKYARVIVIAHHVCSLSGAVMDIKALAADLHEIEKRTDKQIVLIVDGAQAIGNIQLNLREFDVPFYLASGHKWLLGVAAIGLLFVRYEIAEKILGAKQYKELMEPSRAFSSYGEKSIRRRSATVAVDSLISLGVMTKEFVGVGMDRIERHNKALAHGFETAVRTTKLSTSLLLPQAECGIVSLRHRFGEQIAEQLAALGIICTTIPWPYKAGDEPEATVLRFCFHYMMSELDVSQAAEALATAADEVSIKR